MEAADELLASSSEKRLGLTWSVHQPLEGMAKPQAVIAARNVGENSLIDANYVAFHIEQRSVRIDVTGHVAQGGRQEYTPASRSWVDSRGCSRLREASGREAVCALAEIARERMAGSSPS